MISTQPGSTPVSSFKVLSLDEHSDGHSGSSSGPTPSRIDCGNNLFQFKKSNLYKLLKFNSIGPYGEQDDEQLFVQQVVPDSDQLYVRLASTGKRYII